jgi:hypothetical protein
VHVSKSHVLGIGCLSPRLDSGLGLIGNCHNGPPGKFGFFQKIGKFGKNRINSITFFFFARFKKVRTFFEEKFEQSSNKVRTSFEETVRTLQSKFLRDASFSDGVYL